MVAFLTALNAMSPLGLAVLLGLVLFYQQKNAAISKNISDNHLSGLPEMAAALERIEALLNVINNNLIYVRARINGKDL